VTINPAAGKPADPSILVNVPKLVTAYYELRPDPSDPRQRVVFGTSGHRGSAFDVAFNEWHILAITQAICDYRKLQKIDGPLFLGMDTHALSEPAFASALEVLAANNIEVMLSEGTPYTPTPAVSHAILLYNRARKSGLADGIVITPSHNPPDDGGFKYDPPHGGPADSSVTSWIESKANAFLERGLDGVKRTQFAKALRAPTTHKHDFLSAYVSDLNSVVDMNAVRDARIKLGVDPLGGAGIDYWPRIAEQYGLDLTIVNQSVDPTFRFMTVDWDGKIRMDPSSPYAMQRLIALKDKFDIAFASDTDHDRHGIVTKGSGLLPPNHYLSVCVSYLFANRPNWSKDVAVGKTVVSSSMIDRVSARLGGGFMKFRWALSGLSKDCSPAAWVLAAKRAPVPPFSGATAAYGPPIKTESFLVYCQQKLRRVWAKIRVRFIVSSPASWEIPSTNASMLPLRPNKKPLWHDCPRPTFTLPKLPVSRSRRF
jgi:phosphoglucomutase